MTKGNINLYSCMYLYYVKHEVMPHCDFAHVRAVVLLKLHTIIQGFNEWDREIYNSKDVCIHIPFYM